MCAVSITRGAMQRGNMQSLNNRHCVAQLVARVRISTSRHVIDGLRPSLQHIARVGSNITRPRTKHYFWIARLTIGHAGRARFSGCTQSSTGLLAWSRMRDAVLLAAAAEAVVSWLRLMLIRLYRRTVKVVWRPRSFLIFVLTERCDSRTSRDSGLNEVHQRISCF